MCSRDTVGKTDVVLNFKTKLNTVVCCCSDCCAPLMVLNVISREVVCKLDRFLMYWKACDVVDVIIVVAVVDVIFESLVADVLFLLLMRMCCSCCCYCRCCCCSCFCMVFYLSCRFSLLLPFITSSSFFYVLKKFQENW